MSANANLSLHRNKLQESRIASSKQSRHSTKSAKTNHHHGGGGYSSTDHDQDDRLIFVDDDFAPNDTSPDSTDDDPLIFVDVMSIQAQVAQVLKMSIMMRHHVWGGSVADQVLLISL